MDRTLRGKVSRPLAAKLVSPVVASSVAHVNPVALRWARESIGYSIEEAAHKITVKPEKLSKAEQGDVLLTLRQAEKAAHAYERPLVDLFRPEPPLEAPDEAQFRRLPGAPALPWPPAMRALARRLRGRQEAATEIYELIGDTPPWEEVELPSSRNAASTARGMRQFLDISIDEQLSWQDVTGYLPLRTWTDAIEALGVLVMQEGGLPITLLRGFASTDNSVPAILVNTKDDPRARAFTLVHELGHLVRTGADEAWCNRFAAELLMPAGEFVAGQRALSNSATLSEIDQLARAWSVTPAAAVTRAVSLELISRRKSNELKAQLRERPQRSGGGGGDFYRNTISRLGPSFIGLVMEAVEGQALTFPAASGLLKVKVNNFDRLRQAVEDRSTD